MKLIDIEKLTDKKFLNLYELTYKNEETNKTYGWTMSSRHSKENLSCISGKIDSDCVCIIPKTYINGEPALIVIKEFRLPINNYVYGFPAGMIDNNETAEEAAKRELYEEIGATKFGEVKRLTNACLNSEGMTDESTITLEAEILELGQQHLEEIENIKYEIVKISNLQNFAQNKILGAKFGIYAPLITKIYNQEQQIKNLQNELNLLKNSKN